MSSVWYIGRSDKRVIDVTDWPASAPGAKVVWDKTNGFSLPASQFTAAQLAVLAADDGFNTTAPDGPRPGTSVTPDNPDPFPQYLQTSELEAALPGRLTDAALTATFAVKPYVPVSRVIGHMGGLTVYPEHSLEGHTACAQQGYGLDLDVRAGAGGVPLVIHDSTYTRTMYVTNDSGTLLTNVSDATEIQHIRGSVLPAAGGAKYGTAPRSLDWYLDTFGGKTFISLETKDSSTAFAQTVIDKVVSRGLQQAVLLNSAFWPQVQLMRAAGCRAMFIDDTATPAAMAAAGVEAVGVTPATITGAAYVNSFHAVGVKVITYAVQDKYTADQMFGYGVDSIYADSPWMLTARYPVVARQRWDDGLGRPNRAYFRQALAAGDLKFAVRPEVPCLELQDASNLVTGGKVGSYPLSELGTGPTTGTYRFKATFMTPLTGQTGAIGDRWFGLFLGIGPINDNGPFGNGVTGDAGNTAQDSTRRGYFFRIRRDGNMYINYWNFGSGADIANNSAAMPASPYAAAGAGSVELEFEIVITATTLVLRCLTAGYTSTTTTVTHSSHRNVTSAWTVLVNGVGVDLADFRQVR